MPDPRKTDEPRRGTAPGMLPEDRPHPHNMDAERAVLAAMLLEPTPSIDIAVEKLGSESVFYHPAHRVLFKTILRLWTQKSMGVDIITVASELRREGVLEEMGGEVFLVELQNAIATTANIDAWCELVRETSILRSMINVCAGALTKCFSAEGEEPKDLIDQIEGDIFKVREQHVTSDILELKDYIKEVFNNVVKIIHKEVEVAIPTEFPALDQKIGGLKKGEMVVLAARPSIGKTSLALNILRNIALKKGGGRPVAFFSLEMTAEQIARRLLCTEADVAESQFFDGSFSDMTRLTKAVMSLKRAEVFIDPTGGLTINDLRSKARQLKHKKKIELIVIDYLQLMKAGGRVESRQQEVSEISGGIKKLAKELDIPILVLAQLNRESEKGTTKATAPKLSHLRESGSIEQDADIVVFLHRESRDQEASKLIIEKNRNGPVGEVELKFNKSRMLFQSVEHRYTDEDKPDNI